MKQNVRQALTVAITAPFLLLAAICDPVDDEPSSLVYDDIRIQVSPGPNFTSNDTIWISGRTSSRVFDESIQDSVPTPGLQFSSGLKIARMRPEADIGINAVEANSDFELILQAGEIDFLGACPTDIVNIATPTTDGENLEFRIGLKPNSTGDYVLYFSGEIALQNNDLNLEILQQYPFNGNGDYLGISFCGTSLASTEVSQSGNSIFFSVD